jgi:hypothetical protein
MKTSLLLASAAFSLLFVGCASVSVTGERRQAEAAQRPSIIYVQDFDTGQGEWKVTSRSRSEAQFRAEVANLLSEALVASLNANVGPAQRISGARSAPPGSWLVTGRFIRVSEGSPAARMIVGLGAGGSKMETETLVFDSAVRGRPFLRFATTGGSNAMPGMIISSGPTGAVSNIIQQANRGTRDDAKRTARMITASIAEYLAQRGWLSETRVKVKRPGKFQLIQPTALGTSRRGSVETRSR